MLLDCVMPEAVFDTVMSNLAKVWDDFIFAIVLHDSLSNIHKLHVPRFLALMESRGHFSDRCLGLHPLRCRCGNHTRESGRLLGTLAAPIWLQAGGTRSSRRSRVAALSHCVESVGLVGFGMIVGDLRQERSSVGRAFKG